MNYGIKKELKLEGVGYKLDYIERAGFFAESFIQQNSSKSSWNAFRALRGDPCGALRPNLLQTRRYLIITLGYAHPMSVLIPLEIKYVNVKSAYGIIELGCNTSPAEKRVMSQFIATLIELSKKATSKSGNNKHSGSSAGRSKKNDNKKGVKNKEAGFIVRDTWSTQ